MQCLPLPNEIKILQQFSRRRKRLCANTGSALHQIRDLNLRNQTLQRSAEQFFAERAPKFIPAHRRISQRNRQNPGYANVSTMSRKSKVCMPVPFARKRQHRIWPGFNPAVNEPREVNPQKRKLGIRNRINQVANQPLALPLQLVILASKRNNARPIAISAILPTRSHCRPPQLITKSDRSLQPSSRFSSRSNFAAPEPPPSSALLPHAPRFHLPSPGVAALKSTMPSCGTRMAAIPAACGSYSRICSGPRSSSPATPFAVPRSSRACRRGISSRSVATTSLPQISCATPCCSQNSTMRRIPCTASFAFCDPGL